MRSQIVGVGARHHTAGCAVMRYSLAGGAEGAEGEGLAVLSRY